MFRLSLLIAIAACTLAVSPVRADSVESRIEVASRSDSERARGAIRGLFRLLVQMYPGDDPLSSAQRRALSGEANDFVQRYGYLTDADGKIVLRLQFDEKAIRARVEEVIGVPDATAGGLEPALLWLVVTQGAEELLLSEGAQGLLPDTLDQVAAALSQPLVFPRDAAVNDGTVSGADIRDVNTARLEPASRGYAVGQTLTLSMVADGDNWRGDWTLLSSGEQWTSNGPLADMLQVGLTAYQGRAAALEQSSIVPRAFGTVPGDVTLSVSGVAQSADYAWLSVNLRDRLAGRSVKAVSVGSGEVVFVVGSGGDAASVAQAVAGLSQLQIVFPEASEDRLATDRRADLNYLLVR